jgi:hypothetical protein
MTKEHRLFLDSGFVVAPELELKVLKRLHQTISMWINEQNIKMLQKEWETLHSK